MAKYRDEPYGSVLYASFLAALQEFIGTSAVNFHLTVASNTSVQVVAGSNSAQVGLGIDGLWRYVSATVNSSVTGSAGTYDVFAVTGPNNFVNNPSPPPPELDMTDYTFALQVLLQGATPTITGSVTNYRKVGEVDWSGTQIVALRPMVGEPSADAVAKTSSLRTLGTGSTQAVAGNDTRLPSQAENDALQGTNGTPSNSNRFVTDSDTRLPSQPENDALQGTNGSPGNSNRYVTTSDSRLVVLTSGSWSPITLPGGYGAVTSFPVAAFTTLANGLVVCRGAAGNTSSPAHGDTFSGLPVSTKDPGLFALPFHIVSSSTDGFGLVWISVDHNGGAQIAQITELFAHAGSPTAYWIHFDAIRYSTV